MALMKLPDRNSSLSITPDLFQLTLVPPSGLPETGARDHVLCDPCLRVIGDILSGDILKNDLWAHAFQAYYCTLHHLSLGELEGCGRRGCPLCRFIFEDEVKGRYWESDLSLRYYVITADLERSFNISFQGQRGVCVSSCYILVQKNSEVISRDQGSILESSSHELSDMGTLDSEIRMNAGSAWPLTAMHNSSGIYRQVLSDPTSEDCLALARRWINTCSNHHERCSRPSKSLPRRVIDVGEDECSPTASLYISNGESAQYLTLSYSWGGGNPSKTIRSNYEQFQLGFEISNLPQTLKDAIFITRKLGYRFLWVDSLCIIQDDDDDWEREAAIMHEIFFNSVFTISAVDALNVRQGFLGHRSPDVTESVSVGQHKMPRTGELRELSVRKCTQTNVYSYCLSRRAWTLQERVLARAVLHYSPDGMMWECSTHCVWEHGEENPTLGIFKSLGLWTNRTDLDKLWEIVTKDYSRRKLTRGADKLPALAGLARYFWNMHHGRYLAGIWEHNIPKCFRWARHDDTPMIEPPSYRAPSWSWAALDGELDWKHHEGQHVQIRNLTLELLEAQVKESLAGSFGHVQSGFLVLRGTLKRAFYEHGAEPEIDPNEVRMQVGGERGGWLHLGLGQEFKCWMDRDWTNRYCYALPIDVWKFSDFGSSYQDRYQIWLLALEKVTNQEVASRSAGEIRESSRPQEEQIETFKRVGIAYHELEYPPIIPDWETTVVRII